MGIDWIAAGIAVLASLGAGLLKTEVEGWAPKWAEKLKEAAIKRLSPASRERMAEEWAADLHERPTPLSRLHAAIGMYIASEKIERERRREVGRILSLIANIKTMDRITEHSRKLLAPQLEGEGQVSMWRSAYYVMAHRAYTKAVDKFLEACPSEIDTHAIQQGASRTKARLERMELSFRDVHARQRRIRQLERVLTQRQRRSFSGDDKD